ncbi:MAG: hypothetical protein NTZ67_09105 [Gammaproteobacteria bacterium]|nr:hypothetical protein [Gammaproteobacteria bacterium]
MPPKTPPKTRRPLSRADAAQSSAPPSAIETPHARIKEAKAKKIPLSLKDITLKKFNDLTLDEKDDLNFSELQLNQSVIAQLVSDGYGDKIKDAQFVGKFENFRLCGYVKLTKAQYKKLNIQTDQDHFVSMADTLTEKEFREYNKKRIILSDAIVEGSITTTAFSELITLHAMAFRKVKLEGKIDGSNAYLHNVISLEEIDLTAVDISPDFFNRLCNQSAVNRNVKKITISPKQLIDLVNEREGRGATITQVNIFNVLGCERSNSVTSNEFQKLRGYGVSDFEKMTIDSNKKLTSAQRKQAGFKTLALEAGDVVSLEEKKGKNKELIGYKIENAVLTHEEYDALEKIHVNNFVSVTIKESATKHEVHHEVATESQIRNDRKKMAREDGVNVNSEEINKILAEIPQENRPRLERNEIVGGKLTFGEVFIDDQPEKPFHGQLKILYDLGVREFEAVSIELTLTKMQRARLVTLNEAKFSECSISNIQACAEKTGGLPIILSDGENNKLFDETVSLEKNSDNASALKEITTKLFSSLSNFSEKSIPAKSTGELIAAINGGTVFQNCIITNLSGIQTAPINSKLKYDLDNIDFSQIHAHNICDDDKKILRNLFLGASKKNGVKISATLSAALFPRDFIFPEGGSLEGVEIQGGLLYFSEAENLYALGVRKFSDVQFRFEYSNDCAKLKVLNGAEFDYRCSIENIIHNNKIEIADNDSLITLSCSDYSDDSKEAELFDILTGAKNIDLSDKSAIGLNSAALNTFLFVSEKNGMLRKNLNFKNAAITDLLKLSHFGKDVAYIDKQIKLIDELNSIKWNDCDFKKGIELPLFILNQCADFFGDDNCMKNSSFAPHVTFPEKLSYVLHESKANLQKIQSQELLKETNLEAHQFERILKANNVRNFRGCVISGDVNLSATHPKRIAQLDLQNTTFNGIVDFSNLILAGGKLRNAHFMSGIKINPKTDFRGCDVKINWPNDMPLIFDKTVTTVAELYGKMLTYSNAQGKDDFIARLEKKYAGQSNSGQKLFEVLRHIQKYESSNWLSKKIQSHRTKDALFDALSTIPVVMQAKFKNTDTESNATAETVVTQAITAERKSSESSNSDSERESPRNIDVVVLGSLPRKTTENHQNAFTRSPDLELEKADAQRKALDVAINEAKVTLDSALRQFNPENNEKTTSAFKVISESDVELSGFYCLSAKKTMDQALSNFELKNKSGIIAAYQFLIIINESSDYVIRARDVLNAALLLENPVVDDAAVSAYLLIQTIIGESAVERYQILLRDSIYPNCLKNASYTHNNEKYKLFEPLFIVSGVIKNKINDCQHVWANMRLADLSKAKNPICVDPIIVKNVAVKIAARKLNAGEDIVIIERQLYIVELIKAGKGDEAKQEVAIMKAVWGKKAELPVCAEIYHEASFIDLVDVGIIDQAVLDRIELRKKIVTPVKNTACPPLRESEHVLEMRQNFALQRVSFIMALLKEGRFLEVKKELDALLNGQALFDATSLIPKINTFLSDLLEVEERTDSKFMLLQQFNSSALKKDFENAKLNVAVLAEKEKNILSGALAFTRRLSKIINPILTAKKISPACLEALKICVANKDKLAWVDEKIKLVDLLHRLKGIVESTSPYGLLAECLNSLLLTTIDEVKEREGAAVKTKNPLIKIKEPHELEDFTQEKCDQIFCAAYNKIYAAEKLIKEVDPKWRLILRNKAVEHTLNQEGNIVGDLNYYSEKDITRSYPRILAAGSIAAKIYPKEGLHKEFCFEKLCTPPDVSKDEIAPVNVSFFKYQRAYAIQIAFQALKDCPPEKLDEQLSYFKELLEVSIEEITKNHAYDDFGKYLNDMFTALKVVKAAWLEQTSAVIAFPGKPKKGEGSALMRAELCEKLIEAYALKNKLNTAHPATTAVLLKKRQALKDAIQAIFMPVFRYGYTMAVDLNVRAKYEAISAKEGVAFEKKTDDYLKNAAVFDKNAFKYVCCYQLQGLRDEMYKVIDTCPEDEIINMVNLIFTDISDVGDAAKKEIYPHKGWFISRHGTYASAAEESKKEFEKQRKLLPQLIKKIDDDDRLAKTAAAEAEKVSTICEVVTPAILSPKVSPRFFSDTVVSSMMARSSAQPNEEWAIAQVDNCLNNFATDYPALFQSIQATISDKKEVLKKGGCSIENFFEEIETCVQGMPLRVQDSLRLGSASPCKIKAVENMKQAKENWKKRQAAAQLETAMMTDEIRRDIKKSVENCLSPIFNYVRDRVRAANAAKIAAKVVNAVLIKGVAIDGNNISTNEAFALYAENAPILKEMLNQYDALNYRYAYDLQEALTGFCVAVDCATSLLDVPLIFANLSSALSSQEAAHWGWATLGYETNNKFNLLNKAAATELKKIKEKTILQNAPMVDSSAARSVACS